MVDGQSYSISVIGWSVSYLSFSLLLRSFLLHSLSTLASRSTFINIYPTNVSWLMNICRANYIPR